MHCCVICVRRRRPSRGQHQRRGPRPDWRARARWARRAFPAFCHGRNKELHVDCDSLQLALALARQIRSPPSYSWRRATARRPQAGLPSAIHRAPDPLASWAHVRHPGRALVMAYCRLCLHSWMRWDIVAAFRPAVSAVKQGTRCSTALLIHPERPMRARSLHINTLLFAAFASSPLTTHALSWPGCAALVMQATTVHCLWRWTACPPNTRHLLEAAELRRGCGALDGHRTRQFAFDAPPTSATLAGQNLHACDMLLA